MITKKFKCFIADEPFDSPPSYGGDGYELEILSIGSPITLTKSETYGFLSIETMPSIYFSQATNNCQIVIASGIETLMEWFDSRFFQTKNAFEKAVTDIVEDKCRAQLLMLDISEKARNNISKVFPNYEIYSHTNYTSTYDDSIRYIVLLNVS